MIEDVEPFHADEHRPRLLRHFAFGASYHTGHTHRILGVRDNQHLRGQLSLSTIEKIKPFAGPCPPHDNPPLLQPGVVEGVQRLPRLQHDVVGYVDNVVDGTHPGRN